MLPDLLGAPIPPGFVAAPTPPGKVVRELTETWIQGTMPWWLESTSGTITYSAPSASQGYVQAQTGAISGNSAHIRTTFQVATANFTEIGMWAEGFHLDTSTGTVVTPAFYLGTTGVGCLLFSNHAVGSGTLTLRLLNSGGNEDNTISYNIVPSGEGVRRRNLGLVVRPREKAVYVMADDQVIYYKDASAKWADGTMRPMIELSTRENVAHYFRMSQTKLRLVHN